MDLDARCADLVGDIRELRLPDNYADVMVAIHVVEHVYRWEVDDMLRDWIRILKPGGKVVIEVPSMEKVFRHIAMVLDSHTLMSPTFSWWPLWGDPKYRNPSMVHKWGYTFHMLAEVLVKAGFSDVKVSKPRYHFPQRDMRVEAVKPC